MNYCENKIVIGDFNLVMDVKLDRRGLVHNNERSLTKLMALKEHYYLTEVWRDRNPDVIRYSWKRVNHQQKQCSRIDFALVSNGLSNMIENCFYIGSLFTDHSALYMYVAQSSNKRGVGYWKLNTSLLKNKENTNYLKSELCKICQLNDNLSPTDRWVYIKSQFTKMCQQISRQSAHEEKEIIAMLSEKMSDLEESFPLTEHMMGIYEATKADLETKMLERAERLIFKSKARWHELGEKNTRYFYSLEKARYTAKTCQKLITDKGEHITDDRKILHEQEVYYTKLYSKDENVSFNIVNRHNIRISEKEYDMCDSLFTLNELKDAVFSMKLDKTPGSDGWPVEMYQTFWDMLSVPLLELTQQVYTDKCLHETALTGILNLIPKGGKDSRYLKNLRPITLLNTDYKIIEKMLARRLDKVLPNIIHSDQTGFMAGRHISSNIRKIFDVMQYCKINNIDGVLLNLDFAKCFDNIAFSAILGSLDFLGFPNYIKNWITTLYSNFNVKVQNNGKFTNYIPVEKSVHQGGCVSVQLFLLCAEIVALELRQCSAIQGIPVQDIVNLLNQYADDMNISSLFEQSSLNSIFHHLNAFRANAGFQLNYDKTELYRIGPLHGSDVQLYTKNAVKWTNQPINILGVDIDYGTDVIRRNYSSIIRRTHDTLSMWKNRSLSLLGKINIINTLVASLYVYKLTVLPNLPKDLIKSFDNAISDFLWNGRKAKISLRVLQNSRENGGLNLVNISRRQSALKVSWIKTIRTDHKLANLAYYFLIPELGEHIWTCNLAEEDVDLFVSKNKNVFWFDVLCAWSGYNFEKDVQKTSKLLWCNSLIRINGRPVLWKECIRQGLMYVHQLYDNGRLINLVEAANYGLSVMCFNSLVSALPKAWKKNNIQPITNYKRLCDKKNISQIVYKELSPKNDVLFQKVELWNVELDKDLTTDMVLRSLRYVFKLTNVPKLRSFHYRLVYRGLILNTHLYHWKYRDNNLCSFCEKSKESYLHLFYQCECVQSLMHNLLCYCTEYRNMSIQTPDVSDLMFGLMPNRVFGTYVLIMKQYIYAQRCMKKPLNFLELRSKLWLYENIEYYVARNNDNMQKHKDKWCV